MSCSRSASRCCSALGEGETWERNTSELRCCGRKTRATCAARDATSTTSCCPACSTRRSCAARTRTRASGASPPSGARGVPGVARVFTFADLERWMKPHAALRRDPAGAGGARRRRDEDGRPARDVQGRSAPRRARSSRWCWPRRRAIAEDAAELVEVDYEPLAGAVDPDRGGRARRARALRRRGATTSRCTSPPASATPTRAFRGGRRRRARALRHPALRRACRSRRAASSRSGTRATAA